MKKNKLSTKSILTISMHGIKTKPMRFVITILLFIFCLTIIGTANSASGMDITKTELLAFYKGGENVFALGKTLKPNSRKIIENESYFSIEEAKKIESEYSNYSFNKIYARNKMQISELAKPKQLRYYSTESNGFVVLDDILEPYGAKIIAGSSPKKINEMAIPYYIYQSFVKYGYESQGSTESITNYEDILGKEIKVTLSTELSHNLKIVGIVDTNFDEQKYEILKSDEKTLSDEDFSLSNDTFVILSSFIKNSFHCSYFTTKEFVDEYILKAQVLASLAFGFAGTIQCLTDNFTSLQQKNTTITWSKAEHNINEGEIIMSKQDIKSYIASLTYILNVTDELIAEFMQEGLFIDIKLFNNESKNSIIGESKDYQIVGYYVMNDNTSYKPIVMRGEDLAQYQIQNTNIISTIFTKLNGKTEEDLKLFNLAGKEIDSDFVYKKFSIFNYDIELISSLIAIFKKIGFYCGIAISVFAALMMFNFISATISAKKKEIGILRALGAKNKAVLGIFLSESLITAFMAIIFSFIGTAIVCYWLNSVPIYIAGNFKFLFFGFKQMFIIITIGVLIATIGSILPILKLVKKRPMEIIRN